MDELKAKVRELEIAKNDPDRVKILQDIGAKLINEYVIRVGGLTIAPMLVEAYYYSPEKFDDTSVHSASESKSNTYELARKRQKNHFGELYVHYGTKDGLDIVLSDGDYYLSFLIKNALVNGHWMKQSAITDEGLCGRCETRDKCRKGLDCKYYCEQVLEQKPSSKQLEIVFTKRKGIKNNFSNLELAALPIDKIRNKECDFTPGESCTEIVQKYIKCNIGKKPEEDLKKLAYGLIKWEYFG